MSKVSRSLLQCCSPKTATCLSTWIQRHWDKRVSVQESEVSSRNAREVGTEDSVQGYIKRIVPSKTVSSPVLSIRNISLLSVPIALAAHDYTCAEERSTSK